jgi:hypothetical protein
MTEASYNYLTLDSPLGIMCEAALSAGADAQTGYRIGTEDSFQARMLLYKFRSKYPNAKYANLQIRISPDNPEYELWILNSDKEQISSEDIKI